MSERGRIDLAVDEELTRRNKEVFNKADEGNPLELIDAMRFFSNGIHYFENKRGVDVEPARHSLLEYQWFTYLFNERQQSATT